MESVQRIRYPPFDHSNIDPSSIPITEVVVNSDSPPPTPFKIGSDEGWMVEWRNLQPGDENLPRIQSVTTTATLPFLMRTRNGWYIEPDPLHAQARKLIAPTVVILILSLFLHAIAPAVSDVPLLSWLTEGSFKIGPLDYPKLLIVSFPIFVLPIILRMIANSRDVARQNTYIANPLPDPEIRFTVGDGWIEVNEFEMPDGVLHTHSRLQAGVAIPERKTILQALNRPEGGQPPPGMSTRLHEKRIISGEEHGTGVGESTPLPIEHARVLFLEPMRVLASSSDVPASDTFPYRIQGPEPRWPGSIYSSIIALHWELIVQAQWNGINLRWVKPIIMPQTEQQVVIDRLPLRGARSEESDE